MMRATTYLLLGLGGYLLLRKEDEVTSLHRTVLRWPVIVLDAEGERLTGRGGSIVSQEFKTDHPGVDIAVPGQYTTARANVVAVAQGKVVRAWQAPRGWAVLLAHEDWLSGYLHLAELDAAVREGATVEPGQRLGTMGADPQDPQHIVHLHFQLAPHGHIADPLPYLQGAV